MYEDYLMHYRTKGSKNGYTKYPDKYTPIGEKAKSIYDTVKNTDTYNTVKDTATNAFTNAKDFMQNTPLNSLSEKQISDNLYKMYRNNGWRYKGPKATTEDDYFTFMKRDLLERADKLDSKIDRYRANDYAERISRFLDATGMRDTNPKDVLGKIKDAITGKEVTGENQKYAKAVADFLLPTDRKRQANLDDNFVDFVAKDIGDRYNAATNNIKKKIKEKLTSKRALKFGKRFVKRGAKKIASMIGEYLQ